MSNFISKDQFQKTFWYRFRHTLLILLLMAVWGAFCAWHSHRTTLRGFKPVVVHDTTYITKTLSETLPAAKSETFQSWKLLVIPNDVETRVDTLHRRDTTRVPVFIHDTLYLPITQKYYERLDGRLRLWVSGYEPQLDKWELDERTAIVKKRLGFSVGVGTGVIYTPFHKSHIDAGLGVYGGLTYSF